VKPLFTIHAGEFVVGDYVERTFRRVNVWVPAKDTGVDLLVSDRRDKKRVSFASEAGHRSRHPSKKERAMHILWWIIVGLIAGWLTGKIMKGAGYGVIGDIILGILGAVIGGFIMRSIGFAGQGGLIYTILVALGGAVVLTAVVRVLKKA